MDAEFPQDEQFGVPLRDATQPVTLAALVLALALGWRSPGRVWLVLGLLSFVAVHIATMWYFVPEQAAVIADANLAAAGELKARVKVWLAWNYLRMATAVVGSVFLLRAIQATR